MKLWYVSIILVVGLVIIIGTNMTCAAPKSKEGTMNRISSVDDLIALFPTTPAQIERQVNQVIQSALAAVNTITAPRPADQRTYANTAQPLDRLASVSDMMVLHKILSIMNMTHPQEDLRKAAHAGGLKIEEFSVENIDNNIELYKAFKAYVEGADGVASPADKEQLSAEQRYYLKETMDEFRRNGLHLPQETRQEVVRLQKELAKLGQDFDTNINEADNTITVDLAGLQGLEKDFIENLKKTDDGLYILGVDYPTYFNVRENCTVEDTRKRLYLAFEDRAYPKNETVLKDIIAKRDELAHVLGYPSYAHLSLDDMMVHAPERAQMFEEEILLRVNVKEQQEFQALTKELPEGVTLVNGKIKPWDTGYIKNYYKKKHLNIDENLIAEYFPTQRTLQQLLDIYRQFLGVEFKEVPVKGLWHEDVKLVQAFTKENNELLGYLILDLYPRPNKFSHACEESIVKALQYADGDMPPAAAIVICNFPKATANKPALLRRADVNTFFHEFGHAVHELLGRTTVGSFAGTNTKMDFVEMPSQMLEEWLWDKDILKMVSSHYITGQPLPDKLIDTIIATKNFDTGDQLQRQIFLGTLSLDYYMPGRSKDPHAIYAKLFKKMRPHVVYEDKSHMFASFGHLYGYGPGYYGYLWSKVFALDMFSLIKKHGLLNPEIGRKYVHDVLSKGGSKDPNDLLQDFLGRKPDAEAFFADLGLSNSKQEAAAEFQLDAVPVQDVAV